MVQTRPHSSTPKGLTGNSIPRQRKRQNTFSLPPRQLQGIQTKSSYFRDRSATVCPTDFRSFAVDAPEIAALYNAKQLDRNKYSPSPQASQHFSRTETLQTGKTRKVVVFPRPLSHRMSLRLPVKKHRYSRDTSTPDAKQLDRK
jgi:hypothetical protein